MNIFRVFTDGMQLLALRGARTVARVITTAASNFYLVTCTAAGNSALDAGLELVIFFNFFVYLFVLSCFRTITVPFLINTNIIM